MKKKVEILAPAGSYESLKAAIAAGADAVYIGGTRFGARAYADNLDEQRLLEVIDYVHLHERKIYLTINTLLKESELQQELYDYLLPYYKQGLDAVIVQDMGVLCFLKEYFPDLPIHASTQMTITDKLGAKFLENQGVERIVTSREMHIDEIKEITENTSLEIESFVHGALCYCYSGQCLYSSLIGGRSGNRGQCAQP
ncbi:MAG: U32 family peptidase, partial [Tyzzerella sp.]|nr:U32 family peptidase [Tyzzerella sp.]